MEENDKEVSKEEVSTSKEVINNKKEETVTFKKSTMWMFVSFIFMALFLISILTGGFQGSNSGNGGSGAIVGNGGNNVPSGGELILSASAAGETVLGDEDAEIAIIEFSDFECPFCGRAYANALPQLKEEYINSGKVKFVYKHFPLDFHPLAMPAALASECANEQGKFWDYHDIIFENQGSLSEGNLRQWASDVGLDVGQFTDCYDSQKYLDEVNQDFQDGNNAGVSGTPGFIIGKLDGDTISYDANVCDPQGTVCGDLNNALGFKVSGALPFSTFKQILDTLIES
ncbi:hypothetical protein CL617_03810 [archaeon]|nr:hypothetical protein [archaeon]|tara:strand:+ start:33054 stop:33911 length:858 start_codon:yes stop_codon:yes gene_type:complete